MNFHLGDAVVWSSQAKGCTKTKCGEVVEVVEPGQRPSRDRFPSLYKHAGCGFGRKHVSYVVMVKRTPRWPVVANLRAGNGLVRATVAAQKSRA